MIQLCDAQTTTKKQPQVVSHLSKSSQEQGRFPASEAHARAAGSGADRALTLETQKSF